MNVPSPGSVANLATVTGLKCETRYRFQIREWGDGITYRKAWGPFSRVFHATTGACDPVTATPMPTPTPTPPTVEYAPLVEPPGRAYACRGFPWSLVHREDHLGPRMISVDGRHEAQAELYSTRLWYDQNQHCIEARFISESTPGADRIEWSGKQYKTERVPNLEGLSLGNLDPADIVVLIDRYEDQPPTDDTPYFRKISRSCETCRGGTIQTEGDVLHTRVLKIPTIYARGKHTFRVGGAPILLMTEVKWTMPRQVFVDCVRDGRASLIACREEEYRTIENELSEDIDTGPLGDLLDLASTIYEFFNPS